MMFEIFFTFVLVWSIWYVISTYKKRKNMPAGPFPYPFVGNIPHIIRADPARPFDELAEKYGDIYTVTFPSGTAVVLNTASLAREARLAAGKQEDLMGKTAEFIYPFTEIMGNSLSTCDYSTSYHFQKKAFVSAMHAFRTCTGSEPTLSRTNHAVNIAINQIEAEPKHSFSPKQLFDFSILVQFWEWLTSKKISLDDEILEEINELSVIVRKQALLNTVYRLFPFLSYIPTQLTHEIERAKEIRDKIFPTEYRASQQGYVPGIIRNLTDSFINAYEKELAKETTKDIGSKDADIPGLMFNVVVVGSVGISTWLTWFFLHIVLHPNVQRKIHEELDKVVGFDRMPCWQDSQSLPYLQATLCEAGRASGMMTLVGTNAIRDTTIAGYHIPKGTFVALNLPKVHKDEREWLEPEIFKPERFLDQDGKFLGWNKLYGFMPFGIGRRACPGQSLAKIMMFSFSSALLHRFNFELPAGAERPTTKESIPQIVTRPNDFLLVAHPRI